MAEAPINTYNSAADLSLAAVPVEITDPVLYSELLDIHNAVEILLTHSDDEDAIFAAFIAKFRNNTPVTGDYTVLVTDGTIEVDASAGDIDITFHPVSEGVGYRYDVKRIDTVTTNKVTLFGDAGLPELIDERPLGINVSTLSSYTIKGNEDEDGWNII